MTPFCKNEAQEEAIRTLNGPVLIVSCPGSGKTTTLVRRIHALTEAGVTPSSILMVTFTRDAAAEMSRKYTRLFGGTAGVTFATIHSLCFNILRYENRTSSTNVLSENQKMDLLGRFYRNHGFYKEAWDMSVASATAISVCKNNYLRPEDAPVAGISRKMFAECYHYYIDWCDAEHMIDYDDMLTQCLSLLKQDPQVLSKYQRRFQYIQCDEYQDTNFIQRDILYLLSASSRNLCVVGDDDQSIYSFRGARPEIMLSFSKDFPDARIIHMGTNYRSGQLIVDAAGTLIGHNTTRFKKDFVSYRGQTDHVTGEITVTKRDGTGKEMQWLVSCINKAHEEGTPYNDMAVLFRTNKEAQGPVTALSDAQIPYYSTETVKTIYDSFIFEDILCYVRLATGCGQKRDMLHVLNRPTRYFKESIFRNASYEYESMLSAARQGITDGSSWKREKAEENVDLWLSAFGAGQLTMENPASEIFERLSVIKYRKFIRTYAEYRDMDPEELESWYDELKTDASHYPTIAEWFAAAEIYKAKIKEETKKKDQNGVVITTMHRAKGLEWKNVFIIDADKGTVPHSKSGSDTDEERRLFYVAMTRARDHLFICSTKTPSPFIREFMADKKTQYAVAPETIPKFFPGKVCIHKKYGRGVLIGYTPTTIIVNLDDGGRKEFKFPDTFARGLMRYGD